MIPVRQTKFSLFYADGKRYSYGNCLVACISSWLDLAVDEVPNIYTFYNLDTKGSNTEDSLWYQIMNIWLEKKFGMTLKMYRDVEEIPDGFVIVRGISQRGKPHTCIYSKSAGELNPFFDPHPTDQFLKGFSYFLVIGNL